MKLQRSCIFLLMVLCSRNTFAQVDTAFIYNPSSSVGILDLRLAKSQQQYYYLKEGETFSFRETNGSRTNSFLDMTAWDSKPYTEGNLREKNGASDSFVMNYRLLKPAAYDEQFSKGYPLVIVLHGLLERGNCAENKCYHGNTKYSPNTNEPLAGNAPDQLLLNNDYNLVHGGSNYLEASRLFGKLLPDSPNLSPRSFPGFVVFPQNLNGWDDVAVEDAIRIIRLLTRKYNIDEDRIYINGVSHGGHGAYKAMVRAPWLFAAGVLFSAADDARVIAKGLSTRISGIPLWLFQGGKDTKPTTAQTERYVHHFRSKGASVRYTLYPELGHGTWNKAFAEPDFFTWMLKHKRNNVHVYADDPVICSTSGEGVSLSLPEGYAKYQWEHNGVVIDGGSSLNANTIGKYRARFLRYSRSGDDWSDWSDIIDVVTKDPGSAELIISGTRFLPDPNGQDSVTLMTGKEYDLYYWYKDNIRLKGGDSLHSIQVNAAMGNGQYYLKASDFDKCPTRASAAPLIYFDDRAPFSVAAPTALQVKAVSPARTEIIWIDNARDETGFEVWRRRKLSSDEFEPWWLAGIAGANITTFSDNNLVPSSMYQYQIRAFNDEGRSYYFPGPIDASVFVTTAKDTQPPTAPALHQPVHRGIETLQLSWSPSSDNAAIRQYFIIMNSDTIVTQSNDTTFTVNDITVNTNYSLRVVAVDVANNHGEPSNEANVYTAVKGLFYQHSTGAWEGLQEIDWTLAEFRGTVPGLTLSPKTQQDFFNFRFDGYLRIVSEGIYQFRISSDDGSRLSLNDSVLVVNDGIHTMTTTTSPIQLLASGPHRIQIDFFDYDRSDSLLVEYKGPDNNNQWTKIPDEAFTSDIVTDLESGKQPEENISVFPNPTTADNINIRLPDNKSPSTISLTSSTGQLIQQTKYSPAASGSLQLITEGSSLRAGLYLITIQQNGQSKTVRMIIK